MNSKLLFLSLIAMFAIQSASAGNPVMESALNADIRSADDKARDASRKPAETLAFFEVTPESRVLELMPGGGWYTKILGNYLKEKGALYVGIGANPERLKLADNQLEHVKIVAADVKLKPTELRGTYDGVVDSFGVNDLDVVLTFRNMHNLSESARLSINKAVFESLKPGGIYGIIDHTKRHMEAYSEERWRRVDPVQMIKEVQSVGFVFEDYSDLHARAADKLIYDSTHESIGRDSDRFTLKFRKPD
ncbi:MAG: class I SAM-dependent methyltransferase [Gammaproteobacteria bacterium]|nr:class I SAM-dependent methyltransferase [Gammaproteobacteria bacterium]